jgi:predicted nucleic acid-binding protein
VAEIKKADWIFVEKVKDRNLTLLLMQNLDKGEAEAIALAIEKNADIILLDETDAREAADIYRIEKTGVLGILLLAKLKNEIPNLKQEIEKLKTMADFWLKESLIQNVLREAGEIPQYFSCLPLFPSTCACHLHLPPGFSSTLTSTFFLYTFINRYTLKRPLNHYFKKKSKLLSMGNKIPKMMLFNFV